MKLSRRTLLKSALAASPLVASPMLIASRALGLDGETAPSEKVRVGVIGLGGRGTYIATVLQQAKDAQLVAVSDIFKPRVNSYLKDRSDWLKGYDDFRKMIETEKLDGVCCETATHQRAWVAINAMISGANVYIEKPMALTIQEGRAMVEAARKLDKVTQVGTQQRSLPLCRWACEQIANGAIGKVKTVIVPNFVGPNVVPDDPKYNLDPKDCEPWWDIWTNQAKLRACLPEIQYGWSNWGDYDAGGQCFGVSGWGTHSFDQMQMAIGTSLTGPVQIILEEPCTIQDSGKFTNRPYSEDETGAEYYHMAKVVGPRGKIKALFPNGVEARFELDGDRGPGLGCIVVGEKGKLEINRHKIASNPKELAASLPDEARNTRDETVYHLENWIECIKTKKKCNADIEIGQRSTTICELVNIVRATAPVGEVVYWNPEKEQFDNLDAGNALLSRPRREGWELPKV